jgi:hypothetical protein
MLMCRPGGGLHLAAIFDPQGRQDEATGMGAISVAIDSATMRIPSDRVARLPEAKNGWIDVVVDLDKHTVDRLKTAKTLGVTLQHFYEAPVFLGVWDMDFSGGRKMLPGFLSSCH